MQMAEYESYFTDEILFLLKDVKRQLYTFRYKGATKRPFLSK